MSALVWDVFAGKPVRIFVMGENVWREEEDWPLARARIVRFHLHSGGRANSLNGDGALSDAAPEAEPPDKFPYDPANPVRTQGGENCCDHDHLAPGVFDQRQVENRSDVLVYSTPPLDSDIEVTGPVSVELFVSSSAVDTDFTAKLVDVHPDGFARNLADGILRLRFRNSFEKAEPLVPGEIYKIGIHLHGWILPPLVICAVAAHCLLQGGPVRPGPRTDRLGPRAS